MDSRKDRVAVLSQVPPTSASKLTESYADADELCRGERRAEEYGEARAPTNRPPDSQAAPLVATSHRAARMAADIAARAA